MAISYTWKIDQLERNLKDGGVKIVHYVVNAIDGEYSCGGYGSVGFNPDPTDDSFTAFDDLTENQVIDWIKDQFGAEKVSQIEEALADQIMEKQNPTMAVGMPWAE